MNKKLIACLCTVILTLGAIPTVLFAENDNEFVENSVSDENNLSEPDSSNDVIGEKSFSGGDENNQPEPNSANVVSGETPFEGGDENNTGNGTGEGENNIGNGTGEGGDNTQNPQSNDASNGNNTQPEQKQADNVLTSNCIDAERYSPLHNYEITTLSEPSCSEVGKKRYYCDNCGREFTVVIPALPHDWTEPTYESIEENGRKYILASRSCKVCNETEEEYGSIGTTTIKAKCERDGEIKVGAGFMNPAFTPQIETTILPALGHDYVNGVCSRCDKTDENKQENQIAANDCRYVNDDNSPLHDYEITVLSEPSCREVGEKRYYCDDCGREFVVDIPALSHDWTEPTYTRVEDSALIGTYILASRNCKICGEVDEEYGLIKTLNVPARCEIDGKIQVGAGFKNSAFETQTLEKTILPALGHDYVDGVCSRCGKVEENAPHIHNYSKEEIVTEATCKENGLKKIICECGEYKTETIKAGHLDEIIEHVDVSCAQDGYTIYECSRCHARHSLTESKSAHNYVNNICTGCGKKKSDCDHTWGTPAITWSEDYKTATAVWKCTKNSAHTILETVNTYVAKEIEPKTCVDMGRTLYVADFYKGGFATDTKLILNGKRLNHDYKTVEYIDPNECVNTYKVWQKCDRCGEEGYSIFTRQGHTFKNGICLKCGVSENNSSDVDSSKNDNATTPTTQNAPTTSTTSQESQKGTNSAATTSNNKDDSANTSKTVSQPEKTTTPATEPSNSSNTPATTTEQKGSLTEGKTNPLPDNKPSSTKPADNGASKSVDNSNNTNLVSPEVNDGSTNNTVETADGDNKSNMTEGKTNPMNQPVVSTGVENASMSTEQMAETINSLQKTVAALQEALNTMVTMLQTLLASLNISF